MASALLVSLTACAAATGWERVTTRTCAAKGPPRLCFDVKPDRQVVLTVGGVELIPGECVRAPEHSRGGSIRLRVVDGSTPGGVATRRVHVARAREVTVTVPPSERLKLRVRERERCSDAP